MDHFILAALFIVFSANALGQDIESALRQGPEVPLNKYEKKILDELKALENSDVGRVLLPDGTVQYLYGNGVPTIPCKFLGSCEIVFEKGEVILKGSDSITMTDQRIKVVPMVKNVGGDTESVIVVSPLIDGITTNLHVRTNRRLYRFKIKSTKNVSFDRIAFRYNTDPQQALEDYHAELKRMERLKQYEKTSSYDSNYQVRGSEAWKPTQVFFTGEKTIVEFSKDYALSELPVLFRLEGDKREIVDYRVLDNKYIVDYRLDAGVLVLGDREVSFIHQSYRPARPDRRLTADFIADEF